MSVDGRFGAHLRSLASAGRFGRFVSTGAIGAVFDITTATVLRELGVYPELAVFIGIEVAIIVMFFVNDNWTFAGEGASGLVSTLRRLLTSNVVRAGGIIVQLAAFHVLYRWFGVDWVIATVDAWFVVSKIGGIAAGMFVNYAAESLLTWQVHDPR